MAQNQHQNQNCPTSLTLKFCLFLNGSQSGSLWDVSVSVSTSRAPVGDLNISQTRQPWRRLVSDLCLGHKPRVCKRLLCSCTPQTCQFTDVISGKTLISLIKLNHLKAWISDQNWKTTRFSSVPEKLLLAWKKKQVHYQQVRLSE